MKESPILFNGDTVRAILDDRKTQTRRIVKPHGWTVEQMSKYEFVDVLSSSEASILTCNATTAYAGFKLSPDASCPAYFKFPLGDVGDQLWVRETYMPDAPRDGTWCDVEYYGCKGSKIDLIPKKYRLPKFCIYSASWSGGDLIGWKPPLHMPRWASRIQLEITGIRVERLNDITDEDAFAEGIVPLHLQYGEQGCWFSANTNNQNLHARTAKQAFQKLWNSTGGDWDENPWVWVIEFKRVEVQP